jgi:MFS family permease
MIRNFFHRLLLRRHFWRHATFSEIGELYTSRLLRMLAFNIAASFMSIYLYQSGYDVVFIAGFWVCFFLFKSVVSLPLAALSAWVGPKHAILLSNILFIPSMIAFSLVPEYGLPMLFIVGIFQGASSALYGIAYNTDFSKIKSTDHAGKEIAYMNMIEKLTTGLSPLIGGVLAFIVGPEVVLVIAGILFALAALPLLRTAEQVPPHQKLSFSGFPWKLVRGMGLAHWAVGFDIFTSGTAWSLFAAIFIVGISATNEVYLVNGILMSVVLIAALLSSYAYGRLIDHRRGKELMRIAIIANAVTHASRPFIATPVSVAGLNVANEMATTGYTMSYHRAMFDNADLSGKRIAYLGILEVISNFGASVAALTAGTLVVWFGEQQGLSVFFFLTGAVVLLVLTARFPLYRR